jgi:hypothetical protein
VRLPLVMIHTYSKVKPSATNSYLNPLVLIDRIFLYKKLTILNKKIYIPTGRYNYLQI